MSFGVAETGLEARAMAGSARAEDNRPLDLDFALPIPDAEAGF